MSETKAVFEPGDHVFIWDRENNCLELTIIKKITKDGRITTLDKEKWSKDGKQSYGMHIVKATPELRHEANIKYLEKQAYEWYRNSLSGLFNHLQDEEIIIVSDAIEEALRWAKLRVEKQKLAHKQEAKP